MHVTDPMPLGGRSLATVGLDVPSLAAPAAVLCRGETSDDRVHWIEVPGLALRADAPGSFRGRARVRGTWLRFIVLSRAPRAACRLT